LSARFLTLIKGEEMSKRNKEIRVPGPGNNVTAARSQNPAAEAARNVHLKYIDDHWEAIAAVAWKEYLVRGRGGSVANTA
jgi:hypothetical protein